MAEKGDVLPIRLDVDGLNGHLLQYHTSMTEHHRGKLSVIAGAYLIVSQLMLTTKIADLKEGVGVNGWVFLLILGSILSLLILGIFHHAVNIATVSSERLNVLRDVYYQRLPEERNDAYETWRRDFEVRWRHTFPISSISIVIALLLVLVIFVSTIIRFIGLAGIWLSDSYEWLAIGIFIATQLGIAATYSWFIVTRAKSFYRARASLQIILKSASRPEVALELKNFD